MSIIRRSEIVWNDLDVKCEFSSFGCNDLVKEWHLMMHVAANGELFAQQLSRILEAENRVSDIPEFTGATVVMKRYFLSDATNQVPLMPHTSQCAVSHIQQPPLDGSKLAVWLYLQKGTEISSADDMTIVRHNGYQHLWQMGRCVAEGDSAYQTKTLLESYESQLERYGATLERDCVRTWFFVRDVDTQYGGLVKARRENFVQQGLTPDTHYIASTGIGGCPAETKALVQLGTYAVTGLAAGQQRYLHALTHLNPTIEYGVTFERATLIKYGDRNHIYVSGTASIDNKGQVVHVGDIIGQTHRMWENVEALLNEGGMAFDDVMQIIVYLRDVADYGIVSRMFSEKFPQMPCVFTLAPVCRPAWLVEMECIAVKHAKNPEYSDF